MDGSGSFGRHLRKHHHGTEEVVEIREWHLQREVDDEGDPATMQIPFAEKMERVARQLAAASSFPEYRRHNRRTLSPDVATDQVKPASDGEMCGNAMDQERAFSRSEPRNGNLDCRWSSGSADSDEGNENRWHEHFHQRTSTSHENSVCVEHSASRPSEPAYITAAELAAVLSAYHAVQGSARSQLSDEDGTIEVLKRRDSAEKRVPLRSSVVALVHDVLERSRNEGVKEAECLARRRYSPSPRGTRGGNALERQLGQVLDVVRTFGKAWANDQAASRAEIEYLRGLLFEMAARCDTLSNEFQHLSQRVNELSKSHEFLRGELHGAIGTLSLRQMLQLGGADEGGDAASSPGSERSSSQTRGREPRRFLEAAAPSASSREKPANAGSTHCSAAAVDSELRVTELANRVAKLEATVEHTDRVTQRSLAELRPLMLQLKRRVESFSSPPQSDAELTEPKATIPPSAERDGMAAVETRAQSWEDRLKEIEQQMREQRTMVQDVYGTLERVQAATAGAVEEVSHVAGVIASDPTLAHTKDIEDACELAHQRAQGAIEESMGALRDEVHGALRESAIKLASEVLAVRQEMKRRAASRDSLEAVVAGAISELGDIRDALARRETPPLALASCGNAPSTRRWYVSVAFTCHLLEKGALNRLRREYFTLWLSCVQMKKQLRHDELLLQMFIKHSRKISSLQKYLSPESSTGSGTGGASTDELHPTRALEAYQRRGHFQRPRSSADGAASDGRNFLLAASSAIDNDESGIVSGRQRHRVTHPRTSSTPESGFHEWWGYGGNRRGDGRPFSASTGAAPSRNLLELE